MKKYRKIPGVRNTFRLQGRTITRPLSAGKLDEIIKILIGIQGPTGQRHGILWKYQDKGPYTWRI